MIYWDRCGAGFSDFHWIIHFYVMSYFGEILHQGVNFWVKVQADGLELAGIQSQGNIGTIYDELLGMFWLYSEKGFYLWLWHIGFNNLDTFCSVLKIGYCSSLWEWHNAGYGRLLDNVLSRKVCMKLSSGCFWRMKSWWRQCWWRNGLGRFPAWQDQWIPLTKGQLCRVDVLFVVSRELFNKKLSHIGLVMQRSICVELNQITGVSLDDIEIILFDLKL